MLICPQQSGHPPLVLLSFCCWGHSNPGLPLFHTALSRSIDSFETSWFVQHTVDKHEHVKSTSCLNWPVSDKFILVPMVIASHLITLSETNLSHRKRAMCGLPLLHWSELFVFGIRWVKGNILREMSLYQFELHFEISKVQKSLQNPLVCLQLQCFGVPWWQFLLLWCLLLKQPRGSGTQCFSLCAFSASYTQPM